MLLSHFVPVLSFVSLFSQSLFGTEKHRIKVESWYQIRWDNFIKESVEYEYNILKNQYKNSLKKNIGTRLNWHITPIVNTFPSQQLQVQS